MLEIKWPIKALQLTSDPQDYKDNNISFLDGIGIIPNNHLRGLIQNINVSCNTYFYLYEYSIKGNKLAITNGFYSNPLFIEYCKIKEEIEKTERPKLNIIKDLFNEQKIISNNTDLQITLLEFQNIHVYKIFYVERGYSNFLIPIIIEKKIIAVLECSELHTSKIKSIDSIKEIIRLEEFYMLNKISLPREIDLKLITEKVEFLVLLFKHKLRDLRKNFINRQNIYFNDLLRETYKNNNITIELFWKKTQKIFKEVIRIFPAQSLRLFTSEIITKESAEKYKLVSSTIPNEISKKQEEDIYYKISPSKFKNKIQTSISNPDLLNNVFKGNKNVELDPKVDLIRIFPAPFANNASLIIWITYDVQRWNRLQEINSDIDSEQVFKILNCFLI